MYEFIPIDAINTILDYDGRIKYIKGKYVDIIYKYDKRYDMLEQIINKKIEILNNAEIYHN